MSACGAVAWKGVINEDKFLKDYLKEVQVLRANAEKSLPTDMQESLDSQISCSEELLLVDICYNPLVAPTLAFLPKSNVVCGYTHSAQVGTRGLDSRGMLFNHAFIKKMHFLGDGRRSFHSQSQEVQSCWSQGIQGLCYSQESSDGYLCPPWNESSTPLYCVSQTFSQFSTA